MDLYGGSHNVSTLLRARCGHDHSMSSACPFRNCANDFCRRCRFSLKRINRMINAVTFYTKTTMASHPPTPPSKVPSSLEQWRFKETGEICEWVERYHPGGYHPVNLGDTIHDGKYRVIRKLRGGSYSTVWLALSAG